MTAFEYLKNERGLTDKSVAAYNLGYCDPDGTVYIGSNYTGKDLELDYKFKNTVLFPIFNLYNELIGVSGRKLDYNSNKDLKYVNTVYPKTEHMYGLNLAWQEVLRTGKVYVVEGNVDTIMMHQHGFTNVVGMLGSSLRITQLSLLSRFADEIYLVPDGDTAGDKLIERLWNPKKLNKSLLHKYANLDNKFFHIKLPAYYDPDKFLKEKGADEFKKLEVVELNNAQSLFSL